MYHVFMYVHVYTRIYTHMCGHHTYVVSGTGFELELKRFTILIANFKYCESIFDKLKRVSERFIGLDGFSNADPS